MVKEVFQHLLPWRKKETGMGADCRTGPFGEKVAETYLKKEGYRILEKNYRTRFGEIDIIAEDGDDIVFVEVKTRKSDRYGSPFEAIDVRKQKKMSIVAMSYLGSCHLQDRPARFDVVAVLLSAGTRPQVELIRNAFELSAE